MVTAKDGMQQAEAPYSQGHDVREASETATPRAWITEKLERQRRRCGRHDVMGGAAAQT